MKHHTTASVLLGFTALAAVLAPAYAQEADDAGIAEVVVTAQKRAQSLQDVAVAIDAVSGDDLAVAGVTSARDLTKLVPSLTIANGGGQNASLFLRGVGNRTNNSYNDSAVAVSYDGVYITRAAAVTGAAFYDLERIEVLKGPQGILYGRNATGGALNVLPARPKLGEKEVGVNANFGSYSLVNVDGYVNLPLGENSAVRLAANRQQQDGINRDGTDDRDVTAFRAQYLVEPKEGLSFRLGADFTRLGGKGPGTHYLGNFTPGPTGYTFAASPFDKFEGMGTAAANAYRTTLLGAPGFGFLTPMNTQPYIDMDYWGINAELNADLGFGQLTVVPAYRKSKGSVAFNGPAFNTAVNFTDDKQSSLEVRLAGKSGSVDYLTGVYYLKDDSFANNVFNQEFVLPIQRYDQKTTSKAVFGQLTFNASDSLRFIGGARYTRDHKDMDGIINNFITFCRGLPPNNAVPPASFGVGCQVPGALPRYPNFLNTADTIAWLASNGWIPPGSTNAANVQVFPILTGKGMILKTYSPVVAERTFSRATFKGSVEFDVAPENLLYATYETGYRAGGMQLAEGRPTYEPEFLDSFTIGSKNRFLDNKLQVNVELFNWKYKDQQITYFTVDTSGTLINSNENAGNVDIKGMDVDVVAKLGHNTTLNAQMQYLDAKYKDLHLYTAPPRDNINCPFTLTGQIAGGAPVKDFNCSGNQGVFAPKMTFNLGLEHVVELGNLELAGRVDTAWRDSQNGGFEFAKFQRIESYSMTDLNVTLRNPGKGWSVGAYVLNLEDKRRITFPQIAPTGQAVANLLQPRTYGLRVSAKF